MVKTITLSPEVAEKLDAYAEAKRGEQSALIETLLRKHLGMATELPKTGTRFQAMFWDLLAKECDGRVYRAATGSGRWFVPLASNSVHAIALLPYWGQWGRNDLICRLHIDHYHLEMSRALEKRLINDGILTQENLRVVNPRGRQSQIELTVLPEEVSLCADFIANWVGARALRDSSLMVQPPFQVGNDPAVKIDLDASYIWSTAASAKMARLRQGSTS